MSTITKPLVLAAAAIALTSSVASAAPLRHHHGQAGGHVTPYERVQIAQQRANVAAIKARAWADGRLSFYEKVRIRIAEKRLQALINRARRS